MVHSTEDCKAAIEASQILFNPKAAQQLRELPEDLFLDIMDGVPQFPVAREVITNETRLADLLTAPIAAVFPSKGEFRKMVQGGGLSINKEKVTSPDATVSEEMLLNGKYILVQKGKKNMFLLKINN